jgi:peptidoglycan/LPS O-acetylase OafA/YrhL
MAPDNWLPIIGIILLAFIIMRITSTWIYIDLPSGHYTAIDGLRGILALCVFIHHASAWYFFLRYHEWGLTGSRLYDHLGPTSVALFFMITAFLFTSKLLSAKGGYFDWLQLYTGRFCRIMPLYTSAAIVVFMLTGILSQFTLHVSPWILLQQGCLWMLFVVMDINGVVGSNLILASVVWSLAYEWLFYFSLAWFGRLAFRIHAPKAVLVATIILFMLFLYIIDSFYPFAIVRRATPFAAGIACAFFAKKEKFRRLARKPIWAPLVIALLLVVTLCYDDYGNVVAYTCLSLVFALIAGGQSVFGLLTLTTLRQLGQISYSVYLCHGIVLFVTFRFIVGLEAARQFSVLTHWLVILGCTVALVILCTCTYLWIERPFINKTTSFTRKIRHFLHS